MNQTLRFWIGWGLLAAGMVFWARCDTVAPQEDALLVVEAFVDAEKPLPAIRLWQTRPLDQPYPFDEGTAIAGAEMAVMVDAQRMTYQPVDGRPGFYEPAQQGAQPVPSRALLAFEAEWSDQRATATSVVPPALVLDDVAVHVPDEPVDGIILDSLFFDPVKLDSLQLDSLKTGAEQGLVYLVEVTLRWTVDFPEVGADSAYWIRTQLKPLLPSRPTFDDFFFRPEQIRRERSTDRDDRGRRTWTGVYAVPVETRETPLPAHALRVSIVRCNQDYARFVSSRDNPERREPVSNVQGAIGIFVGLSVDSVRVQVE
ncbi:MAG: hypothetical protein ACE5G0_01840 [Rhodothermales bacterium]